MTAALQEVCVKLCVGQAGMLFGVVFVCGARFLNLTI